MDLNERLAARRRELARQEELVRQIDKQNELAASAAKAKAKMEEECRVEEEARRQLNAMGVESPKASVLKQPSKKAVDAEIDRILTEAANNALTSTERNGLTVMTLVSVAAFFLVWWLGLAVVMITLGYYLTLISENKARIIELGKANSRKVKFVNENNISHASTAQKEQNSLTCPLCKSAVLASDSRCPKCFNLLK